MVTGEDVWTEERRESVRMLLEVHVVGVPTRGSDVLWRILKF
jgi:hypothetical protein